MTSGPGSVEGVSSEPEGAGALSSVAAQVRGGT